MALHETAVGSACQYTLKHQPPSCNEICVRGTLGQFMAHRSLAFLHEATINLLKGKSSGEKPNGVTLIMKQLNMTDYWNPNQGMQFEDRFLNCPWQKKHFLSF